MTRRHTPQPNAAKAAELDLQSNLEAWLTKRNTAFTIEAAAAALGIGSGRITRDQTARIGLALRSLGCQRIIVRPPFETRTISCWLPDGMTPRQAGFSQLGKGGEYLPHRIS